MTWAGAGATLAGTAGKRRMRRLMSRFLEKKRNVFFGVVLLAGILLVAFRGIWLSAIGAHLIVRDDLKPADVIHVIAGDDYRTDYAVDLYRRGLAKILFFTGGWCKYHKYFHGAHGQARAIAQGVPPEAIAYDESSVTSTYEEAEKLKEWIARGTVPVRRIIVVSDPFHMRRARWTYRLLLRKAVAVEMAPVPFERTPFRRDWWMGKVSRKYVREEYEKMVYYVLRYQLSRGKLRDWLARMEPK